MPIENQPLRGNHFGGMNPKAPNMGLPQNDPNHTPAPDSTEAFMVAHQAGRVGAMPTNASSVPESTPSPHQGFSSMPTGVSPHGVYARSQQASQSRSAQTQLEDSLFMSQGNTPNNGGNVPPANGARESFDNNIYEPEPRWTKGKIAGIVAGVVVLLILVVSGFTGFTLYGDAKGILSQSKTLMDEAKTLKDSLKEGNGEELLATAQSIAAQVSDMKDTVSGPAWTIASFVPVYGDDIKMARGMLEQVDILAQDALIPAAEQLGDFKLSNLMHGGTVNIDLLNSLISTLQTVSPVVSSSIDAIDALPEPHIGKLKDVVGKIKEPMSTAKGALDKINEIAPLLPQMLGADGQRTYLLVAQNNVELRSTGGFPGSAGLMYVNNGKIELGEFTSVGEGLEWYDQPGFGVTEEEIALFGDRVGKIPADTPFIPDFPRAYSIFAQMYMDQKGGSLDGVVAIDPVFLQYMLKMTDGVDVNGVNVNGENAARMLMHDAYAMFDTDVQDLFFSGVAGAAFQNLMSNLGNVGFTELFDTVKKGVDEGRLQILMFNEQEEELIKALGAGGELKTDAVEPQLGVYAGDDTASKIAWYLSMNTTMDEGTENPDGSVTYHVTSTFKNNLTHEEAETLTEYVYGRLNFKRSKADMFTRIWLFAPAGGTISNLQSSGGDFDYGGWSVGNYNGFNVHYAAPLIDAQEVVTVTYDVTTAPGAEKPMALDTTPTAQVVAGWDKEK